MKKLIIFISLIFCMSITYAQSYAVTTVTSDRMVYFLFSDTLIKDATFNNTYYVKDYLKNARLTLVTDTMASAADLVKVRAIISRSPNNSDYYSVAGDTVTAAATTASGHAVARTALLTNVYENYLKVTVKAVDSTQNAKVKYYLLIDKNE